MKYAAYTGTRNLYPDMIPSLKSLLMHSSVDRVFLLIEDDEFPEYLPECVTTINVSNQKIFKPDGPNMKSQYTYMAMMRSGLGKLPEFKNIPKVFVMDSDTIVRHNIDELWDIDLGPNYFAAVHEKHRTYEGLLYCNMGVVMYNLDALRSNGKIDEIIDVLNRRRYTWVEQDVNNYLCQGYILELDGDYNANDWTIHSDDPKIMHYAGIKDWTKYSAVKQYRDISWKDIRGGI